MPKAVEVGERLGVLLTVSFQVGHAQKVQSAFRQELFDRDPTIGRWRNFE